MRRREFITLLGATVAWPLTARADQDGPDRRIAVLFPRSADDPEAGSRLSVFLDALKQAGWTEGHNLSVDVHWAGHETEDISKHAEELVTHAPDVILATGSNSLPPLLRVTRTTPIVFATVGDPVGAGFVDNLSRPGGNVTGFALFEFGLAAKWVELLKLLSPNVTRAAVIRDATTTAGIGQFAIIQSAAALSGMEVTPINSHIPEEISRALSGFSREQTGGLIVTASAVSASQRELFIRLATQEKLPAVYWQRFYATGGGLISYGPDLLEQYRRAAGYVDRILRGAKPADLPVQLPSRYELVINLKAAKALGLTVPEKLVASADEVIE
jgi:putative ABC transport system substrate-binding protein